MPLALRAGIVLIAVRAYQVLVAVRAGRTVMPVWASMMPALVIFGTDLLLGSIQTGMASIVVRALPVHRTVVSAVGRWPVPPVRDRDFIEVVETHGASCPLAYLKSPGT